MLKDQIGATMDMIRKGESGMIPFRSGRFFNIDTKWYYSSREGFDHGPFDTKSDAEVSLDVFIQNIQRISHQSQL